MSKKRVNIFGVVSVFIAAAFLVMVPYAQGESKIQKPLKVDQFGRAAGSGITGEGTTSWGECRSDGGIVTGVVEKEGDFYYVTDAKGKHKCYHKPYDRKPPEDAPKGKAPEKFKSGESPKY